MRTCGGEEHQLTIAVRLCVCLSENQKLGILLAGEIIPSVLRSVVDMNIFENFVSVDDVLRFEVLFRVDRSSVAHGKGIIVQRSLERLPYGDVLSSPPQYSLCIGTMSSNDLSDHVIGSCVDVCHNVWLPI